MLLFVTWSVVLMWCSLAVNFCRAKVMTAVFIGVLLLHMVLQLALDFAFHTDGYNTLWKFCNAAILLTFIPSIGFFVFAACRDWKHWLALSAAGAALTALWFFIGFFSFFIKCQA